MTLSFIPHEMDISSNAGHEFQMQTKGAYQQRPHLIMEPNKMEVVPRKSQQLKGMDRGMFSTADDKVITNQIQATHAPDSQEFDLKPLLNFTEGIFHRAMVGQLFGSQVDHGTQKQAEKALENVVSESELIELLDKLSFTINRLSNELFCKCSGGGELHATTIAILNSLSYYSWYTKVVFALAAFAMYYGEFWLVAQQCAINPLAKGVAMLKQVEEILERTDVSQPKFEALNNLINAMLDVAKCILGFKELPSEYISSDTPEMISVNTHIPIAVYWTIRSIVAGTSQIAGLINMVHENLASTTENWELSSLAHKVRSIHQHLLELLTRCHRYIDEKKQIEAFQKLVCLLETAQHDNLKVLKALINPKDDPQPLIDGSTKRKESIEVLRRKNVLLLLTDLEVPAMELTNFRQMYIESRKEMRRMESEFEVVWIPVVDRLTRWTDEKKKQFEDLLARMPWHCVSHPLQIDLAAIKYIKEVWRFNKKPMLVVLDPQGNVVNTNAIHMIWIWGSTAFPFTSSREEELWADQHWSIQLLADNIEPKIIEWISGQKYICLYGGEDLAWIQSFTKKAKETAKEAEIQLEMLYVGKSNPREKVKKNINAISTEKLSHTLNDLSIVWFFWSRLESMLFSKAKQGKTPEDDPIMRETLTILSFDGSDQCWAMFFKGSRDMVRARAETISKCFEDYEAWKERVKEKGFHDALRERLRELHSPLHCSYLILPPTNGYVPQNIACSECGRRMEKFVMYRCCTD